MRKAQNLRMSQIAVRRQELGLTQQQLSERLGISRSAVAMWECEKCVPSIALLPRLAAALGCAIEDLYPERANQ